MLVLGRVYETNRIVLIMLILIAIPVAGPSTVALIRANASQRVIITQTVAPAPKAPAEQALLVERAKLGAMSLTIDTSLDSLGAMVGDVCSSQRVTKKYSLGCVKYDEEYAKMYDDH